MDRLRDKLKKYLPINIRGWLVFVAVIGLASLVCLLLRRVTTSDFHAPLIFVLAVQSKATGSNEANMPMLGTIGASL